MAGWGAFVGRERELTRLQSALAERVRLVLVVGDAGIGKTRFVAEGLARASATGMVAVGGGCLPLAEKLPLLPLADALSELTQLGGGAPFEAVLEAAPAYVRSEVARLLPKLAPAEPDSGEPVEAWRYERLFAGVAELLGGVAHRSPVGLLIEDAHWADGATLDFLTYLLRGGRSGAVSVLVTCRSDEAPLDSAVADWLTHVRQDAGVEEIRLGPLSQAEVGEQIGGLVQAAPAELVEEVYIRAEGHPFFTEQLVAAAVTDSGQLAQPVALPERLAELLVARAAQCGGDARAVLNALAVASRPLTEVMLGDVTGLDPGRVRAAVHKLTAARLLAAPRDESHRPRHALLGEAVAAELLPGERVSLHEQVARALETVGDEVLAAEVAGHWAAAGRTGEELQARLSAANAAEHVFAYADAAAHWRRAIELCQVIPDDRWPVAVDVPHLYLRAVDALEASGDGVRAGAVAEEAYRQFADHADRATAALVNLRAARYRGLFDSPAAGLPLMKAALQLFEGAPPSAEHAGAWYRYASDFLMHVRGPQPGEIRAAFSRALEVAEAASATTLVPQIMCGLAQRSFYCGEVEEGFRLLARAWRVPDASADAQAVLWLTAIESDALLKVGKLEAATRVALPGVEAVNRLGLGTHSQAEILLANAVEGLLSRGRVAEAAALIDPHTTGPVTWDQQILHVCRAEIDLLRGEVDAAARRLQPIEIEPGLGTLHELGQRAAEVGLWALRHGEALEDVDRLLERLAGTERVIFCGWLLVLGMRACADLAERGRACRDDDAVREALAAADSLASWVEHEADVPFTDHPYVASIPATRATWHAERSRATGASDPVAWATTAERWEVLDYRHRAGYARWRQAEALLAAPQGGRRAAATVLSTAADLAVEHVPLMTAIQDLARRVRIDLTAATKPVQTDGSKATHPFRLTDRELDVLQLLGQGKTNPEIAAALFISPRTAGVHVTNILRKLDATTRVQAATIAERAGLLDAGQADGPLAHT
jgi:DNA-binding CsgD family transcriptional regulator